MLLTYFLALVIHLVCVIVFVGYVFFDAFIYPLAKKQCSDDILRKVKKSYSKGSAKIFGVVFLLILFSGIYLASYHLTDSCCFENTFQILLIVKLVLFLIMVFITLISVFFVVVLKKPDPFGEYSHLIGFVLCFLIVICAKAMIMF